MSLPTTIIGIDCATKPGNVGLALGRFDGERTRLSRTELGTPLRRPAEIAAEWLYDNGGTVLLALDAPLGWPVGLGSTLQAHRAGAAVESPANSIFRRETDHCVKQVIGKQPLDVGADRIARTAHAALGLLEEVRWLVGAPVPLAWKPSFEDIRAIEVYPAATLLAHGISEQGYKKIDGTEARKRILSALSERVELTGDSSLMLGSDDALDAAVCVLAAQDFLLGLAMPPSDPDTAEKEGWIWMRQPDREGQFD